MSLPSRGLFLLSVAIPWRLATHNWFRGARNWCNLICSSAWWIDFTERVRGWFHCLPVGLVFPTLSFVFPPFSGVLIAFWEVCGVGFPCIVGTYACRVFPHASPWLCPRLPSGFLQRPDSTTLPSWSHLSVCPHLLLQCASRPCLAWPLLVPRALVPRPSLLTGCLAPPRGFLSFVALFRVPGHRVALCCASVVLCVARPVYSFAVLSYAAVVACGRDVLVCRSRVASSVPFLFLCWTVPALVLF